MEDEELEINPEKKKEVVERIIRLTHKKNKSKEEQTELWILCLVAFQMKPKELRKLTKWIARKIPDKNIKTKKQLKEDVERIIDQSMIITKSLR